MAAPRRPPVSAGRVSVSSRGSLASWPSAPDQESPFESPAVASAFAFSFRMRSISAWILALRSAIVATLHSRVLQPSLLSPSTSCSSLCTLLKQYKNLRRPFSSTITLPQRSHQSLGPPTYPTANFKHNQPRTAPSQATRAAAFLQCRRRQQAPPPSGPLLAAVRHHQRLSDVRSGLVRPENSESFLLLRLKRGRQKGRRKK